LVIVAPGGAVKAWPEWLKAPYVPWVSRLLTPAVGLPLVGHASYAVPAFPYATHAVVLCPNAAAESHETTVYCPALATGQSATSAMAHAAAVARRVLFGRLSVTSLI